MTLRRLPTLALLTLAACLLAGAVWGVHRHVLAQQVQALGERGQNTLNLTVASLQGQLERFERLPPLLADQRSVRSLLLAPREADLIMAANVYLRDAALQLGASDIYIMNHDGETLAASNFDQPHSFVGGNFAFRPYFSDAMATGSGRFYALGTTSNKRGYYFGAPIEILGARRGVMVVKIDVDEIERAWASDEVRIIVTDPEDIVFLSNRADWLFRAITPPTPDRVARTNATRRYANAEIGLIPTSLRDGPDGDRLLADAPDGTRQDYLVRAAWMDDADWSVQVLLPMRAAQVQAMTSAALAGFGLALLGALALALAQRRQQLAERLALQAQAARDLEARVIERTSQLACANAALETEVAERRATEARLRQTQDDLIQAGKLAALGQMSAALSHEFNQPLAAARTYAENAQLLLARDKRDDAQGALAALIAMIDRMARISSHLRTFARKPNSRLRPVYLPDVVAETLALLDWRIKRSGARVDVDIPPHCAWVTAGPVRLQQVLVNLITNALDAQDGQPDVAVHISAEGHGPRITLRLRDAGPGIADGVLPRMFDPFFTTKDVGKGLGLGLSISYNILRDFGGTLSARNHPQGGAEFSLDLARADGAAAQVAAQ